MDDNTLLIMAIIIFSLKAIGIYLTIKEFTKKDKDSD